MLPLVALFEVSDTTCYHIDVSETLCLCLNSRQALGIKNLHFWVISGFLLEVDGN